MLIVQTRFQDNNSRQLQGFYMFDISLKRNYMYWSQMQFLNQML